MMRSGPAYRRRRFIMEPTTFLGGSPPLKQNHLLDARDALANPRVTFAKHSKVLLTEVLPEASLVSQRVSSFQLD